jgi:hypothetical protein
MEGEAMHAKEGILPLLMMILLVGALLVGCVSSGGGGTPLPGSAVTPAVDDNGTTAPLPFPPEIGQTMTAQAKSGFVAGTPVP